VKKRSLLLCLGLLSGVLGASEPPQLVLHGTVTTESGEHPAWFTLICTQGHGGALSLQLALVADTAPGFPFDAYEGPGAPASQQPSAELRVGQQSFASVPVAGWYGGDAPGMFVFGIATTPGQRNAITGAVAALNKPGLALTWIQNSNNMQTPPLMGQFVLDEKQRHALQRIAAPCLPHRR